MKRWLAAALTVALAIAQNQGPPPGQPPPPEQQQAPEQQPFSPEELNSLVAPIALYPDPLLSQVLVACTYPLEVVEAAQWLQQNRGLTGEALTQAAKQQNWDPSVQALVPFPDLLTRLSQDVNWITQLGNAFLAQQSAVMDAVQRMRQQAQQSGHLQSGPQDNVETQTNDGRTVIEIQPTDPQVIYVPTYNPDWAWGAPPIPYPPLFYPGVGVGIGWGLGCNLGVYFGSCCGGGGWGGGPDWFGGQVMLNNYFFHRYGFQDFHGGPMWGRSVWQHDPMHRWGVPYPNRALAQRFHGPGPGGFGGRAGGFNAGEGGFREGPGGMGAGPGRGGFAARGPVGPTFQGGRGGMMGRPNFNRPNFGRPDPGGFGGMRSAPMPRAGGSSDRFGGRQVPQRDFSMPHSVFGGAREGGFARIQSDHGFSSMNRGFGGFHGGGGFRGGGGGGFRGGGGRR